MILNSHSTGVQDYGILKDGTPQPEWTVTDDGRGLLTGTLKFFYNHKTGKPISGDTISSLPKKGDRHPFDERLVCKDAAITLSQNNIGYCDANYVGLAQDPSGIEWSLSCPTEDDPIETHPKFSVVVGQEGAWGHLLAMNKNDATGNYFPKWSSWVKHGDTAEKEFEGFNLHPESIAKDLVGVTSYKVSRPTISVTLHTANTKMLFEAIQNVGKQYMHPPFSPDWCNVSKINRSWLFTSLNISEYAGIYKMDTEYALSGYNEKLQGKTWNKLIYPFGGQTL